MASEVTLRIDASDKEISDFFKEHYSHTDSDVNDDQVRNVVLAHQANQAWRNSLPIQDQLALNNVPATHGPGSLDPENPPIGVTVINAGDPAPKSTGDPAGSTGASVPAGIGDPNTTSDPANAGGSTPGNPGQ